MIGWAEAALLPAHEIPLRYRVDGWLPDRQRAFLDALAEGQSVEAACRHVGLSPTSAYAFRKRAAGAAFAIGWRAAMLHARERLQSALMSRALDGYTETVTRPDGSVIARHRYDNRLALSMLTRLDRLADTEDSGGALAHAARIAHLGFEEYLDCIEHGTANDAAAFLMLRAKDALDHAELPPAIAAASALRAAESYLSADDDERALPADGNAPGDEAAPDPVDTADLVVADRQGWTNEQWARGEAAGLVAIDCPPLDYLHNPKLPQLPAPEYEGSGRTRRVRRAGGDWDWASDEQAPPARDVRIAVWKMPGDEAVICTCFPAPPGFDGLERGRYGEDAYWRACTPQEAVAARAAEARELEDRRDYEASERDRYFGWAEDDEAEGDDDSEPEDIWARADRALVEAIRADALERGITLPLRPHCAPLASTSGSPAIWQAAAE